MKLVDILQLKAFPSRQVKVIRHTTNRKELKPIIESENFDLYQSYQKSDKFRGAEYLITFFASEGTKAILYGVYKVNAVEHVNELPDELDSIIIPEKWEAGPHYYYNLEKDDSLVDLEERLVIDWGPATSQWCQNRLDKDVVEILPQGFVKTFPGYDKVVLTFDELAKIVRNPEANKQWKMMLSNVYAVYLILDTTDGQQYIGSASGNEGIWGRWLEYVKTKDGGNKLLGKLLDKDSERYKKFQFSILNVLPNSSLREQVIKLEQVTKKKLGSKAFGLNSN